jgi:multidrug efflux pump
MNFSEIFIRRPVATTLLTAGIALSGFAAYLQLPVSPLPQIDIPFITVAAQMPGASPETMANSVASPLERHLGQIADVTQMFSSSTVGTTSVGLQFGLDRDIDGAARDVQAAITAARQDLPQALRSNPNYRKFNPADFPILVLTLTSATMSEGQLYDDAYTILSQKLSQVQGVGDVSVGGSSLPAVRVELNPAALFKYGIGLDVVRAALQATNANSPKGAIESDDLHWQIYSNDQALTAAPYRSVVVAYRNKAPVRLSDLGTVTDSVEGVRNMGVSKGQPAVIIQITRQPGANIIDTVDRIRALLPALQSSIHGAAQIGIAVDRSVTIRASLHDVEITLLIAVILVVLVVFVFLRDFHATLIPCVAVPISLIGSFGAMYLLHYSLDNLSLMALTISTGFVVDDAIVVMENIVRHIEGGMPRFEAALLGVKEVGFTVLSMSLSLIAVFIPILLWGGIIGRFFREFAVTLSVAILISMVISLTTTPMMCSRLLSRKDPATQGRFFRWSEHFFSDLLSSYEYSLAWALRHGRLMVAILGGTILLNVWLFIIIPKGMFPEQDTGRLNGAIQADQSISFQNLSQKVKQFVAIVQADPGVANAVGIIGSNGGRGGAGSGRMFIDLKPIAVRKISSQQVIARLRPKLARVPGAMLFLSPAQEVPGGGRQSNSLYQYTLQADDLQDLRTWTPRLVEALKDEPLLTDVNSDQQDKGLEADLEIDRDTAARLGITAYQIDNTLYDAFGERQVSNIYESLNQYHVVMVVAPKYWQDPHTLSEIYVSTGEGGVTGTQSSNAVAGTVVVGKSKAPAGTSVAADAARNAALNSIATTGKSSASTAQAVSTNRDTMIPLSAIAHFRTGTTPVAVYHQGLFASSTVSFNLVPGASLSDAVEAMNRQMAIIHMPNTVHGSFQGSAQDFQKSLASEVVLILAALVTIYLVLGILYESYAHPITILSTLPSAGVGALLALLLFKTEFSLIAMIGLFLLIGLVKKNAIMMIDFAIAAERSEGLSPRDAIFKACILRFRPIMMTTMAAMLGAVPLAIGFGNGAELRRPLGISIVGGLMVSQVLTLYTTPVIYLYVDRARQWLVRLRLRLRPRSGPSDKPLPAHA